jgi:ribonuclease HI
MSNNVAEFLAALDCLRAIYKAGYRGPVALHGDSQLVVKLVNGEWECQAPHLQPLLERLHLAAQHFASVTMTWVPRTSNTEADEESRAAYKEATR